MPTGPTIFDFRAGPAQPFYITKPYGPAAPWPKDRPATYLNRVYGPALASPPVRPDATFLIPPVGAPAFSPLSVVPGQPGFGYVGNVDMGYAAMPNAPAAAGTPIRPDGMGGWFTDQIADAKRYADKYPALIGLFYAGAILVTLRLISVAKG